MFNLRNLFSRDNIVISAVEAVTLALWLALVRGSMGVFGIIVLLVGLIAEHVFSFRARGVDPKGRLPIAGILGVAGVETVSWAGWLALTSVNGILAAVFLFATLLIGHDFESNVSARQPFFSRLFTKRHLGITGIETVTGVVWLALINSGLPIVAFIVLAAGLLIEHLVSKNLKARGGLPRAILI